MNQTRLSDIAPIFRQRLFDLDYRVESALGDKARCCGPRSQVSNQLRERPAHLQLHRDERNFVERKRNGLIAVQQKLSLRKPVSLQRSTVELAQRLVERLAVESWVAVSPQSDDASGVQQPPCFAEEGGSVDPVKGLCGRDQVDGGIRQGNRFGGRDPVFDSGMRSSAVDLLCARIDGNDALEMIHQSKRGLSVARSAIER